MSMVGFPIGNLYFAQWLIPEGAGDLVGTRLLTGSLVFALGIMTVNNLAQTVLWERFSRMLNLVITSPIHPLSYALGVVGFSMLNAAVTAVVVLSFAPVVGIDIHLDWRIVPVIAATALSLTGVAVIVATWAPSQEAGNIFSNLLGIMVALFSPVYFPLERLPEWLQWPVRLSPYTHAAEAIDRILSDSGAVVMPLLYLGLITATTLVVGIKGLRWQED
jgi:ABC-type multidrug transport system permease subunit